MKFKAKKRQNKKNWPAFLLFGGLFLDAFYHMSKKKKAKKIQNNFKDFLKHEEKEVNELAHGQESFKQYCSDSCAIFKDYFIPRLGNDFKPKILRIKSLTIIAVALAILKLSVTGYLFFIYPDRAFMAEQMNSRILELTNQSRLDLNLPSLTVDPVLSQAALAKANDMLSQNYFAHISPSGKKPWDWISRNDYPYLYVGENLGMNFSTAESVHNALMLSPSHKRNILNDNYHDIGIAVLSGTIDGQPTNLLVELFGSKKATPTLIAVKPAVTAPSVAKEEKPEVKTEVISTTTNVLSSETKSDKNTAVTVPSKTSEIKPMEPMAKAPTETTAQTNLAESAEVSPNQEIEHNLPPAVTYVSNAKVRPTSLADKFIGWENYINYAVLIIMVIALLVNIFVKIRIQHKPVIIQTLLVIIFITGLIFLHLHILEIIKDQIAII